MWFGVPARMETTTTKTKKKRVLTRDWMLCPKYDDHSRVETQHNYGGLGET